MRRRQQSSGGSGPARASLGWVQAWRVPSCLGSAAPNTKTAWSPSLPATTAMHSIFELECVLRHCNVVALFSNFPNISNLPQFSSNFVFFPIFSLFLGFDGPLTQLLLCRRAEQEERARREAEEDEQLRRQAEQDAELERQQTEQEAIRRRKAEEAEQAWLKQEEEQKAAAAAEAAAAAASLAGAFTSC